MAKVYCIHPLELNPGVSGEELERFMTGEGAPLLHSLAGAKISLVKGDRGVRAGQYAVLFEYPSVEVWNQAFPVGGPSPTELIQTMPEPLRNLFGQWFGLVSGLGEPTVYTDYVVVAE
jgi:hypothetical protein